jgi:transmembrane sensor
MTDMFPSHPFKLMSGEPDWNVLDRYFDGECDSAERGAIDHWAAADASHAQLLASLRLVWAEAAETRPEIDERAGWRALRSRMMAPESGATAARSPVMSMFAPAIRPVSHSRSLAVAAAMVLAVAAGAFAWRQHGLAAAREVVQLSREYTTARGQRGEVALLDGTHVWLSVDSRLHVPQGYGATSRDVELSGEAYFAVQHDAKRPFRVYTRDAVSEDLGTEFSVRSYAGDSAAVVIVASGKVALWRADSVNAPRQRVELTRGQMGRLDRTGSVRVTDGVDVRSMLAWRDGRLELEERPLADAVPELARWYDIEITIEDTALAHVPMTASFTNQSVDEALTIIAGSLDARYERTGRSVRLMAKTRTP